MRMVPMSAAGRGWDFSNRRMHGCCRNWDRTRSRPSRTRPQMYIGSKITNKPPNIRTGPANRTLGVLRAAARKTKNAKTSSRRGPVKRKIAAFLAGSCERKSPIATRIPSRLKTPGMTARGRRKRRGGLTDKSQRLPAGIKTDPMRRITATAITESGALAPTAYSPSEGQGASYSSTLSSSFLRPQSAAACTKAKTTGCGFFSVDDNCG